VGETTVTLIDSRDSKITVKLFAILKDVVAKKEIKLLVPHGGTVGFLKSQIIQEYPSLNSFSNKFIVSVNHKVATDGTVLHANDEIALLPPVSGG
jgi:molybdopterin synthase catalytic subunit